MPYSNANIDPSKLHYMQEHAANPLEPTYRQVGLCRRLTVCILVISTYSILVTLSLVEINNNHTSWIFSGLVLISLAWVITGYIADQKKRYVLREHDISFYSGLFFLKYITQPFIRIQHVELKRGPLERLFGLTTLQIYSAGGNNHTFEIPGLTPKNAQQIKQYVLHRCKALPESTYPDD